MPKIDYTLSFENYKEICSATAVKAKTLRLPAAVAVLGFFGIAAGYIFLKMRIGSFFPGGVLLMSGLIFTGLSMVLGFLEKPKSQKADNAALRYEFDRYWNDARSLDFDQKGWSVEWAGGTDVREWAALRSVSNLKTMLVLQTLWTPYWFPKDALLKAGCLEELQALAESHLANNKTLFEVRIKSPVWLFTAAGIYHDCRRRLSAMLLLCTAVMLSVYWALSAADSVSGNIWPIALIPVVLVLSLAAKYILQYYRTDWSAVSHNATIMDRCIAFKSDLARWKVEYGQIAEVREIPGTFMLYWDPKTYYLFPKRGFSPEQLGQFRQLIHRDA